MRPKTYFECYANDDNGRSTIERTFEQRHFKEVGMMMNCAGMPLLEAYWLVNKWNKENGPHGYSYWLETL